MKLVKIKGLDKNVTCSYCKEKNTMHRIQGHPYGGRTCCKECFENDKDIQNSKRLNKQDEYSLGEERALKMYGAW